MFLTGIVLGTVRTLVDPYHRFIILSGIAEWFGHIMSMPTEKEQETIISQPLYAYLAESLNLELINVIL